MTDQQAPCRRRHDVAMNLSGRGETAVWKGLMIGRDDAEGR